MTSTAHKIPSDDHPITLTKNPKRVVVKVGDRIIADSRDALVMAEAHYPKVNYIPAKDMDMALLKPSSRSTHCPFKGDCSYFSIPHGGERSEAAVWTYEEPYDAVAQIKGHYAFYPDCVDSIEERDA